MKDLLKNNAQCYRVSGICRDLIENNSLGINFSANPKCSLIML